MLNLGVHVSTAGKIYNSVNRAKKLGCNTMQIFTRNPRQWRKGHLSEEDIEEFKRRVKKEKIKPAVIHIPYTLNLASERVNFHKITIREFISDLTEAKKLGAEYLVTHPGSHKGSTQVQGLLKVAQALRTVLKETKGVKTKILLENTSGSGSWLGYTFSHLRNILEEIDFSSRVGICLDTAHAWAAGYEINNPKGLDVLLSEIDKEVGIKRVKVIHLNDTREKLGSCHDRHADIGKGYIGKKGFELIINHPCFKKTAFILETPKKEEGDDLRNLKAVRRLYRNGI
ncbi:MAG: deoxyribonuclease IV [Candidatus Omnitrophica bacterium]|nr:deoxyribonuclease IV [Candidatus Omnitrophota bacterium]